MRWTPDASSVVEASDQLGNDGIRDKVRKRNGVGWY